MIYGKLDSKCNQEEGRAETGRSTCRHEHNGFCTGAPARFWSNRTAGATCAHFEQVTQEKEIGNAPETPLNALATFRKTARCPNHLRAWHSASAAARLIT